MDVGPHEPHLSSRGEPSKIWVDPASLPNHGHVSFIGGNTPDYVKQLNYNTFMCYGVGEEDCFGYKVGKAVKFAEVNVNRKLERQGRREATTIAEIEVTKRATLFSALCAMLASNRKLLDMLNGAGVLHGGCVAYLIDKWVISFDRTCRALNQRNGCSCCSTPLVVLGLMQGVNGVGVTQSMNVLFHSPAPYPH